MEFVMATKADIINDRVNTAQMELDKRAKKLQRIIAASRGKKTSVGFDQGGKIGDGNDTWAIRIN